MRVLGFGTYDLATHPRAGILLEGLRRQGDEVFEANVPLDLSTAQRIEMVRKPWLAYRLVLRLGRCWWQLRRRAGALGRGGGFDAIVVGYLGQFDVLLARVLFPRGVIVLDQLVFGADTADDRGLVSSGGLRRRVLAALDFLAARAADLVVVDTVENAALLPASQQAKAVVVAVGAPADWFRAGSDRAAPGAGDPLRVVFFGLFTPLQGTATIAAAMAELADRADIEFTMIGRGQDRDEAQRLAASNPHVRWLEWVASTELPTVVTEHDVCLGVFGRGSKAARVVPNKVFQGAAAGCAIVTSDTPPQRRALGEDGHAARFVPIGDAPALADALRSLAADRDTVSRLGNRARQLALDAFGAETVVEPLRERLVQRIGVAPRPSKSPRSEEIKTVPATTAPPLAPLANLRWQVVHGVLERLAPKRVLEIGCGQGGFGARIAATAAYVGIDADETSYTVARSRIEPVGGDVRLGMSDVVGADEHFDLVCAFEVIEHLEDDLGALREWTGHLEPGGHVLVSVPSSPERFGAWDTMVGHYRRYTPAQLTEVLRGAGCTDIKVITYGWPLGYALEAVRNRIAQRRGADARASEDGVPTDESAEDMAARTASSGRQLQPRMLTGTAVRIGVMPFAALQKLRPTAGIGLVGYGRFSGN